MAITQQNIKIGDKRDIQPWVSGVTYQEREEVDINNSIYIALVSHVSTDFATDLAAAKWQVIGGGVGGSPSAGSAGDLQFSDGAGGFQTNNIEAFGTVFMPTVNLGMNLGSATRRWLSIVAREHLADSGRGGNVGYSWTGLPNDAINNASGTGGGIGIKTRSAEKVKVSNQNSTTTGIVLIQDGIPATSNAVVSALLELKSTTKGFLEPRMTGAQIEAIASPATGLKAYATSAGAGDITSAGWWAYDGSNWVRGYSGPTTEQLDFGAKSDNIGKFLVAHGTSDKADDSTKTKTRLGVSWNGTIVGINYMTSEADTTTQMKIHVNGVVQETFLLTNVNANFTGNETLNTSVNAGDYVEIEYDAGQKPGECTMRLIIEKS